MAQQHKKLKELIAYWDTEILYLDKVVKDKKAFPSYKEASQIKSQQIWQCRNQVKSLLAELEQEDNSLLSKCRQSIIAEPVNDIQKGFNTALELVISQIELKDAKVMSLDEVKSAIDNI